MVDVLEELALLGHHVEELLDFADDVAFFVVADDEVDAGDVGDVLWFELGVAACDDDYGSGVLSDHLSDGLAAFAVGDLGDGAGVDDADVGDLALGGGLDAEGFELLAYGAGFGEVEFAAEGEVSRKAAGFQATASRFMGCARFRWFHVTKIRRKWEKCAKMG